MDYKSLFDRVIEKVKSHGIEVEYDVLAPLSRDELAECQSNLDFPLPVSLIELLQEFGNGFWMSWSLYEVTGRDDGPMGGLEVGALKELVAEFLAEKKFMPHWDSENEFPYVENQQLAFETATKMKKWFPFQQEGNGDSFCLDFGAPGTPVVFSMHDWTDGGSGFNGAVMGSNLPDFFEKWAGICFQAPSSLWWNTPVENGSVNWKSDQFSDAFRLQPGKAN